MLAKLDEKSRFFLDTLKSCTRSLDVCIHLLTSQEISQAIVECHKRGVRVRVICDNEFATNKGSQIFFLQAYEVPISIPTINYHMHNKFAIVDQKIFLTGSLNWTVQGIYGNWDNIIVTSQRKIVKDAVAAFETMWNHPNTERFS